jgi:hypothetical protein
VIWKLAALAERSVSMHVPSAARMAFKMNAVPIILITDGMESINAYLEIQFSK